MAEHDVVRLDVAVQQAGFVHRRDGTTQIDADPYRFTRRDRSVMTHTLGERPSTHELHPDADGVPGLLGAVDRDDVVVADAGEETTLMKDPCRRYPPE
jgi:hypothetical protein